MMHFFFCMFVQDDAIQTTPNDSLHMLIGLITNSRAKKVKKEFNGLIQDILALFLRDLWIQLISILTSGLGLFFLMHSRYNKYNFQSNHWIKLKFHQKFLEVLFYIMLKFHVNQTLKMPCDEV